MTDKARLLELAEQCELAEWPDRSIDAAIVRIVNPQATDLTEPPFYTRDVDAALTLVPNGLKWTVGGNVHHGYWIASVNTLKSDGEPWCVGCSNATSSPALALCAAALRAIAGDER